MMQTVKIIKKEDSTPHLKALVKSSDGVYVNFLEGIGSYSETRRGEDIAETIKYEVENLLSPQSFYSVRVTIGECPSDEEAEKQKYLETASQIYTELGMTNERVLTHADALLDLLLGQQKDTIKVSKTGSEELLIYTESDNHYKNLVLDNDGDISLFIIDRKNPKNSYSILYTDKDDINYQSIVEQM